MPAWCSAGKSREPRRLVHARRCNAAHSSYSPTPHLGPWSRGVYRSVVFCVHARACVRVRVRVAGALARGEENSTKQCAAALREQNTGVSPRKSPRGHRRGACRSSQTCQSSHRLSAGAVRLDPIPRPRSLNEAIRRRGGSPRLGYPWPSCRKSSATNDGSHATLFSCSSPLSRTTSKRLFEIVSRTAEAAEKKNTLYCKEDPFFDRRRRGGTAIVIRAHQLL